MTGKKRGRPPKTKPIVVKGKRGRPATGQTVEYRHLCFEIAAAYTALLQDGMSSENARNELADRQWIDENGNFKTLGDKAIQDAIKTSRDFGLNEDDYRSSIRLQKVDPVWKNVFIIDPISGKVKPT